jgi:hypothetical protein
VSISWTRVGPFLPFMKVARCLRVWRRERAAATIMSTITAAFFYRPFSLQMGSADGYLFYSCQGARAADLSRLPAWLVKV